MTKSITRVLALFGLIVTLGPCVIAQGPVHYTIPFGFTVGSKSFAAGDYHVAEVSPDVLRIQSDDYRTTLIVLANAGEPGKLPGKATMTFHRYGDRYFLSKLADPGRGWALPPSTREKELIARLPQLKPLDVIASSRR